jgi:deoxyribodipyrimidine photolyase
MSVYLKYGCVHPRTLHDALGTDDGALKLAGELVWRDFYADVLWHRPESAREELQPAMAGLRYDEGPQADARFERWATGTTGYPIVDAGMRQLLGEAYVHNRVRMIVGSFLTKDLHLHWRRGARHFMQHLRDGDLASNQHGWQWIAGTGSDPAPYFRVFNPVKQGRDHDPDGEYIRRWVPELRDWTPSTCTSPGHCRAARRTATRGRWSTTLPSGRRRCAATPRSRGSRPAAGSAAGSAQAVHVVHRARAGRRLGPAPSRPDRR